jgi:glycine betaine/choline ABC-type transport system substrate-binding protein
MYPEYTGTALTAILDQKTRPESPEEVFDRVAGLYLERFDLRWLRPFGFNNTYAITVKKEEAQRKRWKKISDLGFYAPELRAGMTSEFAERPDGYRGFREAYGFAFGDVRDMDPAIMYRAIRDGQLDLIVAFSTDSRIPGYNLVVLQDDLGFFPPYHAAPVVRQATLDEFPEVARALSQLGGLIDDNTMQSLNYQADQKKRKVSEVVEEFLLEKGLISPE